MSKRHCLRPVRHYLRPVIGQPVITDNGFGKVASCRSTGTGLKITVRDDMTGFEQTWDAEKVRMVRYETRDFYFDEPTYYE